MSDLDNVPVEPSIDPVINVADIWLELHMSIVMLMQEGKGLIVLSDAAMDSLCSQWMRHRIGVNEPAA
jgi:hypothetical protein